ncbi:MAG TPA: iron ABC transporter permease [Candidatus Rubrimentiphilum sp.]|nr:iron ABC transporter permease [Candidatus Rubrimentiphilum sp.]
MSWRFAALIAGLLAIAGGALLVGGTPLAPGAIVTAITHPYGSGEIATIVWQLRLPRIVIGALVGAALAIAGALLQGLLRNPLVDPYLTGVSAGAAVAIVLSIAAGVTAAAVPALGFGAGLGTAVLVAALARRGASLDATRLILAGISLSSLFAAIIALVLTRVQGGGGAPAIVSWLAGTLSGRSWNDLAFAAPYAALGAILAFLSAPALNALRLGDVRAAAVGVHVGRAQWTILASSSLLAASAVTLSGTIGFVGLIVPHVARRMVGSDARYVLAASALLGAALTIVADALSRTLVAPAEIPIGVLLAFIGVPTFLYLYLRDKRTAAA